MRNHFGSTEGAYDDHPITSIPHIALKTTYQCKMKKDGKSERRTNGQTERQKDRKTKRTKKKKIQKRQKKSKKRQKII